MSDENVTYRITTTRATGVQWGNQFSRESAWLTYIAAINECNCWAGGEAIAHQAWRFLCKGEDQFCNGVAVERVVFVVKCEDGKQRHDEPFATWLDAQEFAEFGHACTNAHTTEEVMPA